MNQKAIFRYAFLKKVWREAGLTAGRLQNMILVFPFTTAIFRYGYDRNEKESETGEDKNWTFAYANVVAVWGGEGERQFGVKSVYFKIKLLNKKALLLCISASHPLLSSQEAALRDW